MLPTALWRVNSLQFVLYSLLIFTALVLLNTTKLVSTVQAQEATQQAPGTGQATQEFTIPDPQPVSQSTYKAPQNADYTFQNLIHSGICNLGGTDKSIPDQELSRCLAYDERGELMSYSVLPHGGAVGSLNTVMVALYDSPPTSTGYYLANLGSSFGLIPESYAQTSSVGGSGDAVLQPVLKLWTVSRNIAYFAFILVFMAVGFMIMFKKKLNPQTVIGVQQALPGLIVGLILVTFSYFISALIVDSSFVGMRLVAGFFQGAELQNRSGANPLASVDDYHQLAETGNVFGMFGTFVKAGSFFDLIGSVGSLFATAIPKELVVGAINPPLGVLLGGPFGGAVGNIPLLGGALTIPIEVLGRGMSGLIGGAIGGVIALVLLVALVIQMFRLIWALLTAYIAILTATIFSPFIILMASIPGRGGVLSGWWKTLLANVLIFPAVFGAFLFAGAILGHVDGFDKTLPLFAGINVAVIKILLAYGIVLGTPGIPDAIKSAFGVKDMKEIMGSTMAGFAAGRASTFGATRQAYGRTKGHYGIGDEIAAEKEDRMIVRRNKLHERIDQFDRWRRGEGGVGEAPSGAATLGRWGARVPGLGK